MGSLEKVNIENSKINIKVNIIEILLNQNQSKEIGPYLIHGQMELMLLFILVNLMLSIFLKEMNI